MNDMPSQSDTAVAALAHGHFLGGPVEVPVEPLLRLQGYRDMSRVRPQVREAAADAAERAGSLAAPESVFRRVGIRSCTEDALTLDGGTIFHGTEFGKILGRCAEAIVCVITLGPALDEETERHTANDEILEALFLETAGWIAIERATKDLAQHLSTMLRGEGLALTRRHGPGYADWPLDEQPALFGLLDGAPLQVRLLDSCAMLPKKSRSGLYGLRPLE